MSNGFIFYGGIAALTGWYSYSRNMDQFTGGTKIGKWLMGSKNRDKITQIAILDGTLWPIFWPVVIFELDKPY